MTEKRAKIISMVFIGFCIYFAVYHTFFDQSIVFALMAISGIFTFHFGFVNPKLLTSKSWKEYCEHSDSVTGWEKLSGTPLYFFLVFCSVLYIILV